MVLEGDGVLQREVACRGCGYRLRGLRMDGECPECGLAIGVSLRDRRLRYAEPGWVKGLASGAGLVLVAWVVWVVSGLAMFLWNLERPALPTRMLWQGLSVVVLLVYAGGVWRLTRPEAGDAEAIGRLKASGRIERVARSAARWSAVVLLIHGSIALALPRLHFPGWGLEPGPWRVAGWFLVLMSCLTLFAHLRGLALRMPDQSLAGSTKVAAYGVGGCSSVVVLSVLVAWMTGAGDESLACVTLCFAMFGLVILGIWSLALLGIYWERFRKEAAMAAEAWEDVAAPTGASGAERGMGSTHEK